MNSENIDINQLDLQNHMSQSVVVIEKDDNIVINDTIFLSVTVQTGDELMIEFLKKYKDSKITKYYSTIGITLDNMLHTDAKYLSISGFDDKTYIINKNQVDNISDFIDSFRIMYLYYNQKLSYDKTYEYLQNKTVYYLQDDSLSKSYLCCENDDDNSQALVAFLSKDIAKAYISDSRNIKINKGTLKEVCEMWQSLNHSSIILEPHTDYWIEILTE